MMSTDRSDIEWPAHVVQLERRLSERGLRTDSHKLADGVYRVAALDPEDGTRRLFLVVPTEQVTATHARWLVKRAAETDAAQAYLVTGGTLPEEVKEIVSKYGIQLLGGGRATKENPQKSNNGRTQNEETPERESTGTSETRSPTSTVSLDRIDWLAGVSIGAATYVLMLFPTTALVLFELLESDIDPELVLTESPVILVGAVISSHTGAVPGSLSGLTGGPGTVPGIVSLCIVLVGHLIAGSLSVSRTGPHGTSGLAAGQGASIAAGYIGPVLASALLLANQTPADGIGNILRILVVAGVGYPAVFGALGGLATTKVTTTGVSTSQSSSRSRSVTLDLRPPAPGEQSRPCPYCKSSVRTDATVCHRCLTPLPGN